MINASNDFLFLETISAGFMVIIAVVCGIIVTILVLSLMILCCMKNPACCYRMDSASKHKPTDVERYSLHIDFL